MDGLIVQSTHAADELFEKIGQRAENDLPFDERLFAEGDLSQSSGPHCAQRLLQHKPDALFVASDVMVLGALRAIREAGRAIPGDIAVVAFDDLPPAEQAIPPPTAVCQPICRLGSELVKNLLDIIDNGRKPPRRVIFGTELVIRESCGAHLTPAGI